MAPRSRILWYAGLTALVVALALSAVWLGKDEAGRLPSPPEPRAALKPSKTLTAFEEAVPLIDAHRAELPAELQETPATSADVWSEWLRRRDRAIRARLARGDEDSVVNLWLYGTSFTSLPRATPRGVRSLGPGQTVEGFLLSRLDDLLAGILAPANNERLRFAREVIERQGVDLRTEKGLEDARAFLVGARERVIAENDRSRRDVEAAWANANADARLQALSSVYEERGLSSDTSLLVGFAVEEALGRAKAAGSLAAGSLRRVAIVGPGLDFTDKTEGYDFYPLQSIQPFALIDSIVRLGLAGDDGSLRLTTFDLSPRVNRHLEAARAAAVAGTPYVIQLPLDADPPAAWSSDLQAYWQRAGNAIGEEVPPIAVPAGAGRVRVRAVGVRPETVAAVEPRDLNIVVERLALDGEREPFDLVLVTNVLVYYGAFEQALAAANLAAMIRPGGFLLTNYPLPTSARLRLAAGLTARVYWDAAGNGDTLLWYERVK